MRVKPSIAAQCAQNGSLKDSRVARRIDEWTRLPFIRSPAVRLALRSEVRAALDYRQVLLKKLLWNWSMAGSLRCRPFPRRPARDRNYGNELRVEGAEVSAILGKDQTK